MRVGMTGILYASNKWATFGVVFRDGVVVDSAPYAWRWVKGASVDEVVARLMRNYDLEWIPDDRQC